MIRTGHDYSESDEKRKEEEIEQKIAEIEEIIDNYTPFKGKPSSFFRMKKNKEPPTDPSNPFNF